ncbi:EF hand domain-containing protein, putative [Eimeria mitis]|uniref:EF hand domain-containing protein, putative n=1 Tax=Eimeria mitis TaxID=44415 RepID=U6K741_9EIME|nr:EF hand domain-containing protein, putative [Eimeria mitis]CDJ33784.1 EF hand domain-containing protein, putative [Eimeria mitis]
MHAWAGREQQQQPHLDSYSQQQIEGALGALKEDASTPWVLLLEQAGLPAAPAAAAAAPAAAAAAAAAAAGERRGGWMVLSSNAYLRSVYWFVLLSAGLLQPHIIRIPIQVRGLFCRFNIDKGIDILPDIVAAAEESLLSSLLRWLLPKETAVPLSNKPSFFMHHHQHQQQQQQQQQEEQQGMLQQGEEEGGGAKGRKEERQQQMLLQQQQQQQQQGSGDTEADKSIHSSNNQTQVINPKP